MVTIAAGKVTGAVMIAVLTAAKANPMVLSFLKNLGVGDFVLCMMFIILSLKDLKSLRGYRKSLGIGLWSLAVQFLRMCFTKDYPHPSTSTAS